ncbi:multicopper oxidase domain-containing protein [Streptomyces sp. NPDC004542]|uniref:multicopper oxidase domain-containing protein n=1 Tax=Streptomyces sp. NPDC004542 TaxID=3154281 RepID=UPI00339F510B
MGALCSCGASVRPPGHPTEQGPKDTVQTAPGQVTRVKALFDQRGLHVRHCHMAEHEDNEMMRNYQVT